MSYPRHCPVCEIPYTPPFEGADTLERRSGGKADPILRHRAGTLLRLSCRACKSRYWWDFFAGASIDPPVQGPGALLPFQPRGE